MERYNSHGDYRGGLEAVLKFGNSPSVTSFGWLLYNLRVFYERITDLSSFHVKEIRRQFEALKVDEDNWGWLSKLYLLALTMARNDPAKCVEFCAPYLVRLSERNRVELLAVLAKAHYRLERFTEAVKLQSESIALMRHHSKDENTAKIFAEVELIKLETKIPGADF